MSGFQQFIELTIAVFLTFIPFLEFVALIVKGSKGKA